jgi:hypothetical protein
VATLTFVLLLVAVGTVGCLTLKVPERTYVEVNAERKVCLGVVVTISRSRRVPVEED